MKARSNVCYRLFGSSCSSLCGADLDNIKGAGAQVQGTLWSWPLRRNLLFVADRQAFPLFSSTVVLSTDRFSGL